eukprot:6380721-Pyramimonas_sp.AAC.1
MLSKCLPLVAKVVDVEDGDFIQQAGIHDAQPRGAARDDDLEPGLRPLSKWKLKHSLVARDEEAGAASVGDGHVVGDHGRAERLARVLGRVGQGNEVVNGSARFLNGEKSTSAKAR